MTKTTSKIITLFEIIKYLNLKKKNLEKNIQIKNVSNIQSSIKGDLTFCSNYKYVNYLKNTPNENKKFRSNKQ